MRKNIGSPLHFERGAHVQDDPGTGDADALLHQHQQPKAERQRRQQIPVGRDDDVVDHPLKKQRADERENFQRECEQKNLNK